MDRTPAWGRGRGLNGPSGKAGRQGGGAVRQGENGGGPTPAGALLRQAREAAGLTQAGIAGLLGVSQQAVCQAERMGANPTLGFLRAWAAACGAEVRLDLLGRSPGVESARAPAARKKGEAPGDSSAPAPLRRPWTAAVRILWF